MGHLYSVLGRVEIRAIACGRGVIGNYARSIARWGSRNVVQQTA
jgi:hypothetical protein